MSRLIVSVLTGFSLILQLAPAALADGLRSEGFVYYGGEVWSPAMLAGRRETAVMPVEVIDTPPAAMTGRIHEQDVIAQHQVRALAARVLLATVKGRYRDVPAGTVLARVDGHNGDGVPKELWCDLRPNLKSFWGVYDCLEADPNTGKFAWQWGASTQSYLMDGGASYANFVANLPASISYREATITERPTLLMGYKLCDATPDSGPPQFALAFAAPGDAWVSQQMACVWGDWTDPADHRKVLVDRLLIDAAPFPATREIEVKVEGRLPPGSILPLFRVRPLFYASEQAQADARTMESLKALGMPPLVRKSGAAVLVAPNGVLVQGAALITAPVEHGLTGITQNGTFAPYGSPVYGIPMMGIYGPNIVWCSPSRIQGGQARQASHYRSLCAVFLWDHYVPVNPENPMMSVRLTNVRPSVFLGPMTVRAQAIDLPPMTLTLTFTGYKGGFLSPRQMSITSYLDWGEGPQQVKETLYPLNKDGSAQILGFGGSFLLKPGKTESEVIIEQTLQIASDRRVTF